MDVIWCPVLAWAPAVLEGATPQERLLGALVLFGLGGWVAGRLFLAWFRKAVKPDPWGAEVAAELATAAARPLCPRCLEPHAEADWFCRHCGAATGDYNNVNPYLYLFSLGEVLRRGTSEAFPRRGYTLLGFILISLAEYAVFAPVYWVMLALNWRHQGDLLAQAGPPEPDADLVGPG
jgi:hypothetical protein